MKNVFAPLLFNGLILVIVLSLVGLTHALADSIDEEGGATQVAEPSSVLHKDLDAASAKHNETIEHIDTLNPNGF